MGTKLISAAQGSAWGFALFAFVVTLFTADGALAEDIRTNASGISNNIVDSTSNIPFLISGIAYLIGLALGISGIIKIKEHVDNPQTPIRTGMIRLLVGGAMFALPFVLTAMMVAITGGGPGSFDSGYFSPSDFLSGMLGGTSSLFSGAGITNDFSGILAAIINSLKDVPGLITAAAYMLGIVLGVQGLLKLKDHVENPDQNPLKESLVRLFIGGAFFAIPTVFAAMASMISEGSTTGLLGIATDLSRVLGTFDSLYDTVGCGRDAIGGVIDGSGLSSITDIPTFSSNSLGASLCGIVGHAGALPAFLNAIAYLFGLVLGFMALLKLRDHALNPQNAPLSQAISRFVAGGAFFALPVVVEAVRQTVTPLRSDAGSIISAISGSDSGVVTGYAGGSAESCGESTSSTTESIGEILRGEGGSEAGGAISAGLDGRLFCAVTDVLAPLSVVLNFFTMAAGVILIMIGISRLLKSEQDGARGPGGLGTFMTFLTGGLLISFNDMIRLVTVTLFSDETTATMASMQYRGGLTGAEVEHAHMVISAILKFMIMIGLISFARGLFIIRGVAEGNQQSSLMAGMTHIIGGALAVNLGPLMNAVQITLGITGYGITFS